MTATPSLAATLPEPVLGALFEAAEFIPSADTCLSIALDILAEMREAAKPDEPVDSGKVAVWQEHLEWLLERLSGDLDRLREDVKATGVRAGRL